MLLPRKALVHLQQWKERSQGRTALLVTGAAGVGKSTLVREFARSHYDSYLVIDFAAAPRELRDFFLDTSDLDLLFLKLQAYFDTQLVRRRSLIVFDEVQHFPRIRQLVKYLVADGRYDYIEIGSHVDFASKKAKILLPSEEDSFVLRPLDLEEFLAVQDAAALAQTIRECYAAGKPLGAALHAKAMNFFRLYLLVGGMPQVVSAFLETRDLDAAQAMQDHLLKGYDRELQDLPNLLQKKVRAIFSQIPVQLSQPLKTFTLTRLSQEVRFRQLAQAFSWLQDGHWVELCHRAVPGKPDFQDRPQRRSFIGYAADTGLLAAQAIHLGLVSQKEVRQSLLYGSLQFAGGMFFHNAVAQMLVAAGHPLCFYAGHGAAGGTIDFLLRRQKKMLPVIVRSSGYRSQAALDALIRRFPRQVAAGVIVYPKDLRRGGALTAIPAYMTFCL